MTEIQKYEPMHKVITKSDEVYYVPSAKIDALYNDMNNSKFIKIGEEIINTYDIKRVRPSHYSTLKDLGSDHRKRVEQRIKTFKSNLNREPTQSEVDNMIEKYRE